MSGPETLAQLLERAATFTGTGLRFLDRRERSSRSSWAEIHEASREVGAGLAGLGVRRGDCVALVYPTGPEFFHAFFGILAAGAVPVPLYPPGRLGRRDEYHRRTAAMLADAGVRLVLAERRLERLLGPTITAADAAISCHTLAQLPDGGEAPRITADPEALVLVQFSSGATGRPKPVALSHRAVVAQARILNGFWPDTDEIENSGVSWLPLYHDMGLIGCVFPALERPGDLTLLAPEVFVARPAAWLRAISRYRATISAAPNFAYDLCVEKIRDDDLEGVDLSSWRFAINGAEPIAPAVLRRFQERFAAWGFRGEALTPVYGLSEASLAVTFSETGRGFRTRRFDREALARGRVRPGPGGLELVSLGRPIPGFEVRVDGEGPGPLHVRGPSLMQGYLGEPEATRRALRDGWLATGDLGFVHEGELYLTGRAKEVIILRGRNYSPHEIEQAAGAVAGVRQDGVVAVSHLPEGAVGEVLLLFVERVRAGTAADLPAACGEAVLASTGLRVDRVHVFDSGTLPRTSSGKLRRGEALRRHLAGELGEKPEACLTTS